MIDFSVMDKYRSLVEDAERYIWDHPETGYKEFTTHEYLRNKIQQLGYTLVLQKDITGFYTVIDTHKQGPTVLLFAELDSLICRLHPNSDATTGAVHACGHHMQCAALLGVAAAFTDKKFTKNLCGKIKICFIPSEEGLELSFKKELKQKGIIKYFSGKQEYLYRGCFDDVDIAFMVHTDSVTNDGIKFHLDIGHNGLIRKITTFKGKSSHAGFNPCDGINALNMASTALLTANSLRETFKEKDYVRFHGIITHGGDAVNAVPEQVVLESFVRASNIQAIASTNKKINRVFAGVACAFGGNVHVEDIPGSLPLYNDKNLNAIAAEVLTDLVGANGFCYATEPKASSTDMGDISSLIPSIHAYSHCALGMAHGSDFKIADSEVGGIETSKFIVALVIKLLENNAQKAKYVIDNFKPIFKTKKDYFDFQDSLQKDEDLIIYNDDGTATIKQ